MCLMDKYYIDYFYKGCLRMYVYLIQDEGYKVSCNWVCWLYYDVMGFRVIFLGFYILKWGKDYKVYFYLLRGLVIVQFN